MAQAGREPSRPTWRQRAAREWGRVLRRFPFASLGFRREFRRFERLTRACGRDREMGLAWRERQPCLGERGRRLSFDRHYVYHTAWAARILAHTRPGRHVDIASSLYFGAIASAFVPVECYDLRQLRLDLEGLPTGEADLAHLPFEDGSLASVSCMHVVEHMGLGRYGDELDPEADRRGMAELGRVLAPGGDLLFAVPVGRPRVVFNAHRVYGFDQVRSAFQDLEVVGFALVPDRPAPADFIAEATREQADAQDYGCGCFHFRAPGP